MARLYKATKAALECIERAAMHVPENAGELDALPATVLVADLRVALIAAHALGTRAAHRARPATPTDVPDVLEYARQIVEEMALDPEAE